MSLESINTIVEGCLPNTPSKLMYGAVDLVIPANANCLFVEDKYNPITYILYARTEGFHNLDVINNPFFENYKKSHEFNKSCTGWPIKRFLPNFRWIFDAQRSLTTRDGRIYIDATYFHKDWRWYLNCVPIILSDCEKIFSGEISLEELNEQPNRVF